MTQEQAAGPQAARVIANRYAVRREIGRGGMGVVWLAEDQMIGRKVAVKELHLPDGVPVEEREVVEQRVLREARTAGRLNDPGIVTVYDVVHESGGTFIVMELLEAPTLADVVREGGALPADQVVALATQLLSALETAHAAGVVHRDVKPANIMLLPNGHVKLTDFGIAQAMDDPKLTTTGILIGSPTYMAPERIRGQEATSSSDLWSLGAVLFYAAEGYAPFERQTTAATMHAVLNEVPYLTKVGGALASAITGLMVGSPEGRLSASQARVLLQAAGQAAPASDLTTPVSGFAGNGTALFGMPRATPPVPAPRKRRGPVVVLAVVALLVGLVGGYFGHGLLASSDQAATPPGREPAITYGPGGTMTGFNSGGVQSGPVCLNGTLGAQRTVTTDNNNPDCGAPHDLQVLDAWTVFGRPTSTDQPDMKFPGATTLADLASAQCTLDFTVWVIPADQPKLHYRAIVPAEQGWDKVPASDSDQNEYRYAYCVLFSADGSQLSKSETIN